MVRKQENIFVRKLEMRARIFASRIFLLLYGRNILEVESRVDSYWVNGRVRAEEAFKSLELIRNRIPGLAWSNYLYRLKDAEDIPFVYEDPRSDHLKSILDAFDLKSQSADASSEYESMVRIGTWLGSRWDHGMDPVPGGIGNLNTIETIKQGMQGQKYWCEVAAKVSVLVFAALGYQARLTTTSRTGYTWEHAILELWSNQFSKWFAMDTDFNVLFEREGVPLSAYELCHSGDAIRNEGLLSIRRLGKDKPSLPLIDLLPYHAYVHVDLRSDWYTRKLPWGSPAGGDLATWWTSRPELRVISPKIRMDDPGRFDWPVNIAWIFIQDIGVHGSGYKVDVVLRAYSPVFSGFQISIDAGQWADLAEPETQLMLSPGSHTLSARVRLPDGKAGMPNPMELRLPALS